MQHCFEPNRPALICYHRWLSIDRLLLMKIFPKCVLQKFKFMSAIIISRLNRQVFLQIRQISAK